MTGKQKVAVVGASGYTGEELLRVLARHPRVELTAVTSRQYAGQTINQLLGAQALAVNLTLENLDPASVSGRAEVFFLALPHGVATEYAVPLLKAGKVVIDLSADFRLKNAGKYQEYYQEDHPAPLLLKESVYGLPELYREALKNAQLIACPGCYPTGTILALAPALRYKLIRPETIIVNSLSGVSGAGKQAGVLYSFSERDENMMPYSVPRHRHIPEIEQELSNLGGEAVAISFTPHLVPLVRGMLTTVVAELSRPHKQEEVQKIYEEFYHHEPFVPVLPSDRLPETKRVLRTNACEVAVRADSRTGRLLMFSAQDNLGKGAATQAVQAFNVRFGYAEATGLL
ncbi:MAG: N-acetyl-gamma-glutamyl-phosphate reductase [Verrucomicrobiales bacterium]|jgi:N-acetyl-gamma-glutamyl-phosphate reductase|nr:N-acetyl-gamma-glutamyl-phosphate reductase [Verrucomicrobiales bacterium]